MKNISIFNEVIGPVMRGPSSSHTAAAYHLAVLATSLLGEPPTEAQFTFDPDGSYGKVYREQGSDLAFAMGLLGRPLTDEQFSQALALAEAQGLRIHFATTPLPHADHPNTVDILLKGRRGRVLKLVGRSIGGGAVEITALNEWPVLLSGRSHEILVECETATETDVRPLLESNGDRLSEIERRTRQDRVLLFVERATPLPRGVHAELEALPGVRGIWEGTPLFFVKRGSPLFAGASDMVEIAKERGLSLGRVALQYESQLLGLSEREVVDEMKRRFGIMRAAVHAGLESRLQPMQLLRATAANVYRSESEGRVAIGGMHTRAAARAMAAMHVNCGMGVVCAAPTAGSAGVLPAVATTLLEERNVSEDKIALGLLAAGAIGVIVAERATFAAEIAGCQVEIGAAGAMAAAAVADTAGGTARQAADAAAISFQNTMGSVCDLVQGIVEIPCHTRNAVAASSAFVCADLILGGYENPIPLDETIDAVYAVGKMMPPELRVTALGGLAVTPSALALKRLK